MSLKSEYPAENEKREGSPLSANKTKFEAMLAVMDELWNAKCNLQQRILFTEKQNATLRAMVASEAARAEKIKEQLDIYRNVMSEEIRSLTINFERRSEIMDRERENVAESGSGQSQLVNCPGKDNNGVDLTIAAGIRRIASSIETRLDRSQTGLEALKDKVKLELLTRGARWRRRAVRERYFNAWLAFSNDRHHIYGMICTNLRRIAFWVRGDAFRVWSAQVVRAELERAWAGLDQQASRA